MEAIDVDQTDHALVPVVPGPSSALLADPKALRAQLDAYTDARKLFLDWLLKNLTAGVDYMVIHRRLKLQGQWQECPKKDSTQHAKPCDTCKAKPTLCKPGSEKICGLLQLRPRFRRDVETWEMLGKVDGLVALVCELVDQHDVVVSEGRGARFLSQDGAGSGNERTADPNKCVKMVQKSAQTDAVLRHAGLSEIFTQDLEDLRGTGNGSEEPADKGDPRPQRKSAPPTPKGPTPADLEAKLRASVQAVCGAHVGAVAFKKITEEKRRALFAEIKKAVTEYIGDAPATKEERASAEAAVHAALKTHMTAAWGITSTKDIPLGLYDAAIAWVRQHVGQ